MTFWIKLNELDKIHRIWHFGQNWTKWTEINWIRWIKHFGQNWTNGQKIEKNWIWRITHFGQNWTKLTEFDILDKIERIGQNSQNLTFWTKLNKMDRKWTEFEELDKIFDDHAWFTVNIKKANEFQTLHRVHHVIAENFDDIRSVRIPDSGGVATWANSCWIFVGFKNSCLALLILWQLNYWNIEKISNVANWLKSQLNEFRRFSRSCVNKNKYFAFRNNVLVQPVQQSAASPGSFLKILFWIVF